MGHMTIKRSALTDLNGDWLHALGHGRDYVTTVLDEYRERRTTQNCLEMIETVSQD